MRSQIYIIAADNGLLKIGISKYPAARLATLSTGLPYDLRIVRSWWHPDAFRVERVVHSALAEHRVRREWFNVSIEAATAAILHAIKENNVSEFPVIPQTSATDWLLENTAWNIERSARIEFLRKQGREMDRKQQLEWLESGGMADYPPPPRPWVSE